MNVLTLVATYRRLRGEPLWKLLASDNSAAVIGILQDLARDGGKLRGSVLHERLARNLEDLRGAGEDLPQTAQAYVAAWVTNGWLIRGLKGDASEEEYEISTGAARAIRMAQDLAQPRTIATESRLSIVLQLLRQLAENTDTDKDRRLKSLMAEREKIDDQIRAVQHGHLSTLAPERAIEQAKEIIALAGELAADFHQVRDQFDHLNRNLREQIMEETDSRSGVLEDLFSGIDVIAESEAGRTFYSFWRLLTDPEQNAVLEDSIDSISNRDFSAALSREERRFLQSLVRTLMNQGHTVHEVLQSFARSLKQFVQSREYLEQRLINQRIREAQRTALELRDAVRFRDKIKFAVELTSSSIRSVSQWSLYDPSVNILTTGMTDGDTPDIDLRTIGDLIAHSEIDFRTLRKNIQSCLEESGEVTIAEILQRFPATQGLGSVVGYVLLGCRAGEVRPEERQTASWTGEDGTRRHARIPSILFQRDRIHELD